MDYDLFDLIKESGFPVNRGVKYWNDSNFAYGEFVMTDDLVREIRKLDPNADVTQNTFEYLARLWLKLAKEKEKKEQA